MKPAKTKKLKLMQNTAINPTQINAGWFCKGLPRVGYLFVLPLNIALNSAFEILMVLKDKS